MRYKIVISENLFVPPILIKPYEEKDKVKIRTEHRKSSLYQTDTYIIVNSQINKYLLELT